MKLYKKGKWFISFCTKNNMYWLFAFTLERSSWFYNGRLPGRPWTYRFRVGPFEFERTPCETVFTPHDKPPW